MSTQGRRGPLDPWAGRVFDQILSVSEDLMTALRQRMIDDLRLRGYAERTVSAYVAAVSRLATHHRTAPDRLSEAQRRVYLVHLTSVMRYVAMRLLERASFLIARLARRRLALRPAPPGAAREYHGALVRGTCSVRWRDTSASRARQGPARCRARRSRTKSVPPC